MDISRVILECVGQNSGRTGWCRLLIPAVSTRGLPFASVLNIYIETFLRQRTRPFSLYLVICVHKSSSETGRRDILGVPYIGVKVK